MTQFASITLIICVYKVKPFVFYGYLNKDPGWQVIWSKNLVKYYRGFGVGPG